MAQNTFYKFPLQLDKIMEGKDAPTCDLKSSISRNIELILMTRFGELRSDPTFGCEIWDLDFELIVSQASWEKKLRTSVLRSITNHEKRLSNIEVSVVLTEIEKPNLVYRSPEIKNKVEIRLSGILKKTGEVYNFSARLFLSPLSLD